jgi:Uma2 family endonuclease
MSHAVAMPDHLLTVEEWDALGVNDDGDRCELVEGVLVVTPRPGSHHQRATHRLVMLLDQRLPDDLIALFDVEVGVDEAFPPTFRAPDVVVVPTAVHEQNPKRFAAADVLVAVEVVSPGTRRTDRVMKFAEYQQAGIEHYWIVDLDDGAAAAFEAYRLTGSSYRPVDAFDDETVSVTEPVPLRFTVAELTRRR